MVATFTFSHLLRYPVDNIDKNSLDYNCGIMSTTSAGHALKQDLKRPRKLAEFEQVDAQLRAISDKIIPSSPYLLTVPEAPPYPLSPSKITDWGRGTLFARNEEQLQYVSFLHRDYNHGLIRAVGGWDNEKGELLASSPNGQFIKSGTSTPKQGQTAGKKMTLADYRNKKAGGQPGVKEFVKPNGQGPKHERVNGTGSTKEKALEVEHPQPPPKKRQAVASQLPLVCNSYTDKLSRSIEDATIVVDATTSKSADVIDHPRSKRQRTSPPPQAPANPNFKRESTPPRILKIPSLLSPTLPAAVEEGLVKLDDITAKGDKPQDKQQESTSAISSKKQPSASPPDLPCSSQEGKSKDDVNVMEKNRGRGASQSQNKSSTHVSNSSSQTLDVSSQSRKKPQDKPSLSTGVSSKSTSAGVSEKSRKEPAVTSASNDEPTKKAKLIVVFKIPKARRKDAMRLLQMPPARAQPKHHNPEDRAKSLSEKRNTATPSPDIRRKGTEGPNVDASQTKTKRARPEDEQDTRAPPPKRSKHPSSLDLSKKPSTPIPPAFKSPPISTHCSAQKIQDTKSIPSRRFEARDADVKTPRGSTRAGTPLAPNSIERVVSRDGRSASNTSSIVSSLSGKSEEFVAWRAEHLRYLRLGRTLKHEADALYLQCEDKDEPQIEKKSIAMGVETILCFMLGYTLCDEMQGDRSRRNIDVQAWSTIFPYLQKVKSKTAGHTLLHGLLLQLEAVCINSIVFSEIERVAQLEAASVSAAETNKQASETGTNSTINGAGSKPPTQLDTMKLNGKIAENNRLSQLLWTEGAFELSVEDLQQSFPITWKRKARAPLARSKEKLLLGALDGDFYLPMSSVTTGIEAVRAGWSLLGEWCKKEEVDWVGRLGL